MPWKEKDEFGKLGKLLLFTAAVLVLLGAYLMFVTGRTLMGALFMMAGAADALMAWGLTRRTL